MSVGRADIAETATRIVPFIRETPILDLGDITGTGFRLFLKLDHLQPTGSFKVRGAFSALTALEVPNSGVTAASGGNFGLAVAYAAQTLGHRATIFVPDSSPPEKTSTIADLGAQVEIVSGFYDDALEAAKDQIEMTGALSIHAFDQFEVMAGQGTAGMEMQRQVAGATTFLVAVGGGGLIGGIATWIGESARIIAVESEECPTLYQARKAGRPVEVEIKPGSATSSLGASRIGDLPWEANQWIDESLLVADDDILDAQRWLWETARLVAEPSACTTLAALLTGAVSPDTRENVVAFISGANTSVDFG